MPDSYANDSSDRSPLESSICGCGSGSFGHLAGSWKSCPGAGVAEPGRMRLISLATIPASTEFRRPGSSQFSLDHAANTPEFHQDATLYWACSAGPHDSLRSQRPPLVSRRAGWRGLCRTTPGTRIAELKHRFSHGSYRINIVARL
jgi:hypothetical protein